jgi:uncharacterized protein YgfB (UPF0149 family)
MAMLDYVELEQALAGPAANLAVAEAHGALCGALCATAGYGVEDWIHEVVPDGAVTLRLRNLLAGVYTRTVEELGGPMFEFTPLLPDDDAALEGRVSALSDWCGGFLYGLGVGRLAGPDQLAGEVGEIIRDFSEISRAEVSGPDGLEANEAAYAELVEFVRAGTLVVYEELGVVRERVQPPAGGLH